MSDLVAAFVDVQYLNAIFPNVADMNIDVDEYPYRGTIIVPKGDTARLRFDVYDQDGNPFDVSTAIEIQFVVAIDQYSPPIISRSLTTSGIEVDGNEITVTLFSSQSRVPTFVSNYYELAVQISTTRRRTVAAGVYRAPPTILGLE